MKDLLVQAFSGIGNKKEFVGDKKVQVPETIAEAVSHWGETTFLKLAMKSHVIDIQRTIRPNGGSGDKQKVNDLQAVARKQAAEGDETLLNQLIAAGFKL